MKALFVIGRAIFGGFFLYNGVNHFLRRKMLSGYAGMKGVPAADVMVPLSGMALLIGGGSIILGLRPKLGALAIAGFLATVSPQMHDFWNSDDPGQRQNDMINFSKNLALLGAALALMAVREPWPASIPVTRPGISKRIANALRRLPEAA